MAWPARCWERIANASWSARVTWNSAATFSPVSGMELTPYCFFISGLMKRQPMVVSKVSALRWNASVALPNTNGARVIDSTPPAIANSISPARMARAGGTDRIQPGGAQPVQRDAGHRLGQSGQQQRHPRHVAVVLAGLVGAAHIDFVELRPVERGVPAPSGP